MPTIVTRGAASAKAFGFSGGAEKPVVPNAWLLPSATGLLTSTDNGNTTTPTSLTGNITGLAWSRTLNITVAAKGASVYWSVNLIKWHTATFPTGFGNCNGITWGGNRFVAIGTGTSPIAYSLDGKTWTLSTTFPAAANLESIAFGNSIYCVVGFNSAFTAPVIWTSPDAITWTAQSISTSLIGAFSVYYSSVLSGFLVGVSSGGGSPGGCQIWQSNPAGTSWNNVFSNTNDYADILGFADNGAIVVGTLTYPVGSTQQVNDIVTNNGGGWGTTNVVNSSQNVQFTTVGYGNGYFLVLSAGSLVNYNSSNGTTWNALSTITPTYTQNPPIYAN